MSKKVLVTPLDWGLGHATRSITIIKELQSNGHQVLLGSAGEALALLRNEFKDLETFELPPYNPTYKSDSMLVNMIRQTPKFLKVVKSEHEHLEDIVEKKDIDVVISDNRYGCWSAKARSIFITHQLNIMTPTALGFTKGIIDATNVRMIRKFHECWIPDYEDHRLSGDLSRNGQLSNIRFVGPLSRFKPERNSSEKYFLLVLLSGPEPQRTKLEKLLVDQLNVIDKPCCIVRGVIRDAPKINSQHRVVDFANSGQLQELISESSIIISRPGYSTIMDLFQFSKKAIFIPTPGQTEQEYLGAKFEREKIAPIVRQDLPHIQVAISELNKYKGFTNFDSKSDLLMHAFNQNGL
jgi:uncharacterized protein (TIGR00661 family)